MLPPLPDLDPAHVGEAAPAEGARAVEGIAGETVAVKVAVIVAVAAAAPLSLPPEQPTAPPLLTELPSLLPPPSLTS